MENYFSNLSAIFKALSDETRLRMLALLLRRSELSVADFQDILGEGQSKVSRHLAVLLRQGIVENRRDGTRMFYRVAEALSPELLSLFDPLRRLLGGARAADLDRG